MNEWLLFAIGMLLTFGTGIFVAAEFSLVALDRRELERKKEAGGTGLDLVINGLKRTSTHLSSAQLGITLTTLLAGYTLEPALTMMLREPLGALGLSPEVVQAVGVTVALIIATLLSMLFGELLPKNYALSLPLQAAKLVMPAQAAFTFVMKPVVLALNGSANWVLRKMGIEPKEELSTARTAQEVQAMVRHSASEGLLEEDTATLLDKALRFTERNAVDVMTPRLKIESIQRLESAQALIDLSRQTGFSRFPVIDEDRDDIVGVAHFKQAIAVPREKREEVPVAALTEEAPRVPETMPLDHLLGTLRTGFQLAIVVDEYGGTSGIVTLEDLVEELIGEVSDEHDRNLAGVVEKGTTLSFPADLRPDELLEQTGINIPESPHYETAAGFILSELGEIPVVGKIVELDGGSTLTVESMDGMRIERLRYDATEVETGSEEEA